ncbi:MAG: TcpE family conjugal transfer membrane protein, partial [Solirubrobacteraceae bacterium]
SSSESVDIRSYRKVFDLERRIYRIDRLRLNPGGIPVRGVVYFFAVLLAVQVLGVLPLSGLVIHMFPWYMRYVGLPSALAALLTLIRVEGRSFHVAALALVRFLNSPRHLQGLRPCAPLGARWHPSELLFLPDGSDAQLRRLRFTGPGAALITVPHERAVFGPAALRSTPRLTLRALPKGRALAQGQVIQLRRGVCLHVHGSPPTQRRLRSTSRRRRATARKPVAHTAGGSGRKPRFGYER